MEHNYKHQFSLASNTTEIINNGDMFHYVTKNNTLHVQLNVTSILDINWWHSQQTYTDHSIYHIISDFNVQCQQKTESHQQT